MLNRVRNALIKHLQPLTSRAEGKTLLNPVEDKNSSFQHFPNPKGQQDLKEQEEAQHALSQKPPQEPLPDDPNPSSNNLFVNLLSQLKIENKTVGRWIGKQIYSESGQSSSKSGPSRTSSTTGANAQNQSGKTLIGVMLDKKAE